MGGTAERKVESKCNIECKVERDVQLCVMLNFGMRALHALTVTDASRRFRHYYCAIAMPTIP